MIFADDNECNSHVYIGYYLEMSFDENYNIGDEAYIDKSLPLALTKRYVWIQKK